MTDTDTLSTWRIQTMTGTQYGSSIIAIAPGCPDAQRWLDHHLKNQHGLVKC